MKQKKILILSFLIGLFSLFNISFAQNISFSVEEDGIFGNGCIVPINVIVDSEGAEISAMDLMMETSLVYKDFVPSTLFPYFLPPVVRSNGLLHVVGFTVDPSERFVGSGIVGTLYFEQKPGFNDGAVKLYFLGEGNTTDTNLSKAGGVDLLKKVGSADVLFSDDLPACQHGSAVITGGFAGMSYQQSLDATMQKIYQKYGEISIRSFLQNNVFLIIIIFLILILILVFIYRKQILSSFNKEFVGKKHTS